MHQTIIKALESHPRSSVDLLICVKSLVNSKIATQPLVSEQLIPILFGLMAKYREDDLNYQKALSSEGCFLNLPMLNLTLDILRMVLESGFTKANEDSNFYADIIQDLNLQVFRSFLEMLCGDWIAISRSLKSQFIMYLSDKNVGQRQADSRERHCTLQHPPSHFQLFEPPRQNPLGRQHGK